MVIRATLRIRHFGCVTEQIRGETTLAQVSGERGWDVFVLSAPTDDELDEGLRIAQSNGTTAEILARTPQTVVFKGGNPPGGIFETIRATTCWVVWPIVYRDGIELWTVAAPDRAAVQKLVHLLSRLGDVRLERVVDDSPEALVETIPIGEVVADLTARQLAALRLAVSRGYYRSPRTVSSDELASAFGVSPSTMREHLRKAEAALLARVATLLLERPAAASKAKRGPGRPKRAVSR